MKEQIVKKRLSQLEVKQLSNHQCKNIKGGNGDTSTDIVIVDIITT